MYSVKSGLCRCAVYLLLIVTFNACSSASRETPPEEDIADHARIENPGVSLPGVMNGSDNHATSIVFGGDTHFDWGVADMQNRHGDLWPVEDVVDIFHAADYRIINLETSISDRGAPFVKKSYIFNANPSRIALLNHMGVNVALLGNNHSMDMGEEGLHRMVYLLRQNGILSVGAGENSREAASPLYFRLENKSFALLSLSSIGEEEIFSARDRAGVARMTEYTIGQVRAVARQAQVVMVSLHWGIEYHPRPASWQVQQAHALIDAGAKLVIGHHPHIPQGIEMYRDGIIIYSLGNFLFGSINEHQQDNIVVRVDFDEKDPVIKKVYIYPVFGRYRDEANRVRLLNMNETRAFWPRFIVQCRELSPRTADALTVHPNGIGELIIKPD